MYHVDTNVGSHSRHARRECLHYLQDALHYPRHGAMPQSLPSFPRAKIQDIKAPSIITFYRRRHTTMRAPDGNATAIDDQNGRRFLKCKCGQKESFQ